MTILFSRGRRKSKLMLERGENKEYLPVEGLAAFNKVTADLLFGVDNRVIQEGRVATVQRPFRDRFSSSCSGIYSDIFSRCKIFDIVSNLGCNHKNIFNDARVP
ncbi:unnamed protein product, partial [Musa banksii]